VGPSTSATKGNTWRLSGGIFQCRAIVPNSSARRASGGVLPSSAVSPHRSRHLLAPIDWGQSIYQQALQCRAIVPNSSARRASGGVLPSSAVSPHRSRHLLAPIDWGQSIYQNSQRCTKQALGYRSTTISTPKFLITILHQVGHFLIDKESKYSF
jgi:hypothetical protein